MSLSHTLPIAAFAASVFLLFTAQARLSAVFAVIASGLELLLSTGAIAVHMSSIHFLLALVLLIAGVFAYLRVSAKTAVSAATVVTLVGLIEVLHTLHLFRV